MKLHADSRIRISHRRADIQNYANIELMLPYVIFDHLFILARESKI